MPNPDTDDTPLQLALEPDWEQGIKLEKQFSTSVQRSWAGRDQRQRKWEKPRLKMSYQRSGLTAAQAKVRIQAIRDELRQPIMGPVWPDGVPLQSTISGAGATNASLNQNPVNEWDGITAVWIWDRANGGEFRTVVSVVTRTVTLSGTGRAYTAGAYVFPCSLMVREISDKQLQPINLETGTEKVEFRML